MFILLFPLAINCITTMYQATTSTENMNPNMYNRILNLLSSIGLIPKTNLAMYIVGSIVFLYFCSSVSVYYIYYMIMDNVQRNPEMVMVTDVSFMVVGALCPFSNFLLLKNFPALLLEPNITGEILK